MSWRSPPRRPAPVPPRSGIWQDRRVTSTRLRLDLAYDGTDFSGWAAQPGLRTVQGELEAALAMLVRAEAPDEVRLTVGGRTDAGVHARGQVAHLDLSEQRLAKWGAPERRATRLNRALARSSPDLAIHSVREVPHAFDARFSALRRRYEYRIRPENAPRDPLTARYTAEVPRSLDLDLMRAASHRLLGLGDFTTFCKARDGATAVRELIAFDWRSTEDGAYAARIEADAFCHSMVRALVGAIVAVGHGRLTADELIALRDARERTSRFTVMPAHGLSLEEIAYPDDRDLAARAEQTRARRDPLDE